ncbi:TPA: hypothetical protein RMN47_000330 [Escherichia coli]|nr:hypothetical protein [Escherichia coli]
MTTITRERLLKIQQWRETYGAGHNVILPAEEAEELARIVLASLEAKPVGEFYEEAPGDWYQRSVGDRAPKWTPLYTTPPLPVVLDGLKRAVEFYEQVKRENTPTETGVWKDAVNWVIEEACRAAMLAGESKADPQQERKQGE